MATDGTLDKSRRRYTEIEVFTIWVSVKSDAVKEPDILLNLTQSEEEARKLYN